MTLSVFEVIDMYCRINLGWIRSDPPMELGERFKHLKCTELRSFKIIFFKTHAKKKKTAFYCVKLLIRTNLHMRVVFVLLQVDDEGEVFHSLDDGQTRFTDLIQLVEFYQLNRGVLPCKLKHHCW